MTLVQRNFSIQYVKLYIIIKNMYGYQFYDILNTKVSSTSEVILVTFRFILIPRLLILIATSNN